MARKIEKQYQITATLKAMTPIHVGGIGDNTLVDLALARDGQGRYYIPGSSLAGALRSWMDDTIENNFSDRLFGPQKKRTSGKDNDDGYASLIIVEDAIVQSEEGKEIEEIRDGVGIDRQWGTAADKIKYDRAILPRGTRFNLELTVGLPPADSKWNIKKWKLQETNLLNALSALVNALEKGEVYLGAAKTRGLGRVKTEGTAKVTFANLFTPEGVLGVLEGQDALENVPLDALPESSENGKDKIKTLPQLIFNIHWEPQGPVMVKAEADGLAVNILPLTSAVGEKLALVLPGSSVKGAIRFQAERILRTLGIPEDTPRAESSSGVSEKQKFFRRLELPLVKTIFGTSKTKDKKNNDNGHKKPLPGLGALLINDCYSIPQMTNAEWQAIATATDDGKLREGLNAAGKDSSTDEAPFEKVQQAYHVAVDRWTGGAAETMLYSALEPFDIKWEELRLTLNLNRIPEEERLAAIAFMLIIIRDLSENRIPLGYGVNRGYGSISINNVLIEAKGVDLNIFENNVELSGGDITRLDDSVFTRLDEAWENWVDANTVQEVSA